MFDFFIGSKLHYRFCDVTKDFSTDMTPKKEKPKRKAPGLEPRQEAKGKKTTKKFVKSIPTHTCLNPL